MKKVRLFLIFNVMIWAGCEKQNTTGPSDLPDDVPVCECSNQLNQLRDAKSMILGEWSWEETQYSSRGSKPYFETPKNTNRQMNYLFSTDSLTVTSNNLVVTKEKYSIIRAGDRSNTQDSSLVVRFIHSDSSVGFSNLFIDSTCMKLVNSYNDAGGDIVLKKK
jgi:hypothetical protein